MFSPQLASDGINRHITQSLLDQAIYSDEKKNGTELVEQVKEDLADYFRNKKRAAEVITIATILSLL